MRTGTRVGRWVGVVLGCALVAGCASGSGAASPSTTRAATTTASRPTPNRVASAGCAAPAAKPLPPGATDDLHLTSQGHVRTYRRFIPPGYDPSRPAPLVLDLHGVSSPIPVQVLVSDFEAKAARVGAVVITPLGSGSGPSWNLTGEPGLPDETVFIGHLLDRVEADACIDLRRVYSTGLSNGAQLSSVLGCALAPRIAAIAPVAGILAVRGCHPARPVPVIAFHGTADRWLAFDGGIGPGAADLLRSGRSGSEAIARVKASLPLLPIPDVVARWAALDGCSGPPTTTKVSAHASLRRYQRCRGGAEVELYVVEGGGHSWPGSTGSARLSSAIGPTTMEIDANDLMWAFFQRHPLPGLTTVNRVGGCGQLPAWADLPPT